MIASASSLVNVRGAEVFRHAELDAEFAGRHGTPTLA
jgi:hypothetical protein